MIELHLRLACGQKEKERAEDPLYTHTRTHIVVSQPVSGCCAQSDGSGGETRVHQNGRPAPQKHICSLRFSHGTPEKQLLNIERMFSVIWRILLELLLVCWMFEGVIR